MEQLEILIKPIPNWKKFTETPSLLLDRIIKESIANKIKIPVRQMSTSHIENCIKCFNGKGNVSIPNNYLGGKEKWLTIFHNELVRRTL